MNKILKILFKIKLIMKKKHLNKEPLYLHHHFYKKKM